MKRRSFLIFLGGAIALCLSTTGYARRGGLRGLGSGIRSGRHSGDEADVLSREELRECFEKEARLQEYENLLEEEENKIDAELREIIREAEEVERAREDVDVYSQSSVDRFNRRIEQHSERVEYYNEVLLKEYNQIAIRAKSIQNEFNYYCGGKQYYIEDYEAVTRGAVN